LFISSIYLDHNLFSEENEGRNLNLDVGCGRNLRASIRLDVNKTRSRNIQASALFLPFRNKVFETVYCYHVLEHLSKPGEALKELIRVSNNVKIRLPFLFYNHEKRFNVFSLGLPLKFTLDRERTRFKIPFRVECLSSFRASAI